MHVLIATDGSKQSLQAARQLKSFADPAKVTTITVLAVTRPLAALSFVDEISEGATRRQPLVETSFRHEAESAVKVVASEFAEWTGTKVRRSVRGGTPATEIIRAAKTSGVDLIVLGSGSRGLGEAMLVGSTALRVQASAPCPVLVVRPVTRPRTRRTR